MGVFHVFKILQMVPTHEKSLKTDTSHDAVHNFEKPLSHRTFPNFNATMKIRWQLFFSTENFNYLQEGFILFFWGYVDFGGSELMLS